MLPYQTILEMSIEKASISKEAFESRVQEKVKILSGLVSREGAAQIVANELGINLREGASGEMKINKISPGMRDLIITGQIVQIYEIHEFENNGRQGKVGSLILGDETGTTRVTLWNEQADLLNTLKTGDILCFESAYAKENRNGAAELHINSRSTVKINPPGKKIDVKISFDTQRTTLENISDSTPFVEVLGVVVQAYEPRFYEVCPQCGKRARMHNNEVVCQEHGTIQPKYNYVINTILDDGTDTIRLVCFGEQAQQLLGKPNEEIVTLMNNPTDFEMMRSDVLGKIFCIQGRLNKNEMFNRFELIAREIKEANPEEELVQLVH